MAKLVSMIVVCLVARLLSTSRASPIDCGAVLANILPCSNYLGNFFPIVPGVQCCNGANSVVETGDTDSLCQCFRLNPLASGFLPSKAQQLPNLCNITSFLPLANCLIPSSNGAIPIPLPPLIPIPPVVPLPPFFPIPPVVPLPPLLPPPPAA
ncbi:hypothetical protein BUALT_Bualt03G0080200 [Buddleja alternifolia]|uniref:Non-specific lipid-transfer protein n=1 Tax=Buddleja alternifolia TaxID=168488 RepID=A0AAV6XZC8_9LAMI|nr:hypothetical protein BUALT_Bualt03G0080200 [Buddleja alternifolia]